MGWVYILTNEAMPGLIKIGQTTKPVQARAKELYTTGVPKEFDIAYEYSCEDHRELEGSIHRELQVHRVNTKREFFKYPADDAYQLLQDIHNGGWRKWTSQHLERFRKKSSS